MIFIFILLLLMGNCTVLFFLCERRKGDNRSEQNIPYDILMKTQQTPDHASNKIVCSFAIKTKR